MRTILSCILLVTFGSLAAGALGGCRDADGAEGASVRLVATTPQLADLARAVGGERVAVNQIIAPNSDPHEYEPRPSDAEALLDADLVLRSGGDVDGWLEQLVDAAGTGAPELTMLDHINVRLDADGEVDPHWWQDPRNAELAVAAIAAKLAAIDPAGAAGYERRAAAYRHRLRALDRSIARCIGAIPARDRRLVTNHDSLAYFTDRYGIELIGAAIPSLSTRAQPSAGEIDELVTAIERSGGGTVFVEAGANAGLERAIADESGARLGGELWTDALGPGVTYIAALRSNAATIAAGLSNGRENCDAELGS